MSDSLEFGQSSLRHLNRLVESESAPRFNFESSDLLTKSSLAEVNRFAAELSTISFWSPGERPAWMPNFLKRVFREVPYFRELGDVPHDFEALPTMGRAELRDSPEQLVPDSISLAEVTAYYTSGTTGSSITIPTDPGVSSKVLVLIERLLAGFGLKLERGPGRVAVAALFHQESTLTYPTLSHYLDGAAALKLNLHPDSGWTSADDRGRYLMEAQPAVITGCPYSLSTLSELVPELRPAAILSSAVALSDGLRGRLAEIFQCPIIDVYSLTEAKFIAADLGSGYHDLISPDLYVEILDENGRVLPHGEFGEICITGGRNRCLPMVRYRTGDFAALNFRGHQPYFSEFQGRSSVSLSKSDGTAMASLDVVNVLKDLDVVGFCYSELGEDFRLEYCGLASEDVILNRLKRLSGRDGEVEKKDEWPGKPHAFLIEK